MHRAIPIDGDMALNMIIQECRTALAKEWNGRNDRVGMIVQKGAAVNPNNMAATIGFASRENAVAQLRQLAEVPGPFSAETLREMATQLEQGPPERNVQCVIIGWNGSTVVELEPDDLRALGAVLN